MLSIDEAFRLTRYSYEDIAPIARDLRDESYKYTTYSPKVFIPLTQLCQDSCSYCAFALSPSKLEKLYLELEDVHNICMQGKSKGCSEALFTLGEAPEKRYEQALDWLKAHGHASTIDYLVEASRSAMFQEHMLSHVNPGAINESELRKLKSVSVSQGMMLETIAGRLSEPGGPHFGSPDKTPARRLATLEAAGRAKVPFTTGILIGIGENRHEIIEALLAIKDLDSKFGHIQEVIVQNFMPKENTGMASTPSCDEKEHLWAISAARLIFGDSVHIQAPPNLVSNVSTLIEAGVDDLGGISPVTIDHVNPERPWPHLETLRSEILTSNKRLKARAAIYPEYISKMGFVDDDILPLINQHVDADGYLKIDPLSDKGDIEIDITEVKSQSENKRRLNSNLPVRP